MPSDFNMLQLNLKNELRQSNFGIFYAKLCAYFPQRCFRFDGANENFSKLFSPPVNARVRLSPAIFDKLLSTSFRKVEHHHHYLHF
ncbi:hypothetical protein TPS_06450 [Trichinella pseudospiralis]|uniref:Uncharacterized protein n=1 Tax=Trichinella pseudospiralis TaxID=6337 RepID=A0A0V1FYS8_TRIPS|nr:hypothetical protein T4D_8018 [Trichinella pseudospiralis]